MDEELRQLERLAQQGDIRALYKLLIRKATINDFNLEDLFVSVRKQLATQLMRSLPFDADRVEVFLLSEGDEDTFFPYYKLVQPCPRGHNSGVYFANYVVNVFDAELTYAGDPEDPNIIEVHNADPRDIASVLVCQQCEASWYQPRDWEVEFF